MEVTERLVRTWMASGRDQEIEATVSGIANGESNLLNVVKALGEYLTAEEDETRTKGVEFLSAVLAKVPADKLNRQSVRVLVAFYTGKLEDTETIVPALKGLATLTTLTPFTSSDATEVIRALFLHVKMRALVQTVRYNVFTIVDSIMARHREALKNMKSEFLSGYINLADGEKDPRNLMLAFAIDRVIGIEFDITTHAESFFNVVFCYFPITFRPPPDDPYGITSDELKESLHSCLCSTPVFGPLAMPLFIEKLTAGSPSTKRDTLRTLSQCMPVYGAANVRVHAKKLWSALRLEIFQPTDLFTEDEALKTTRDLIKVLYPSSEDEDSLQEGIQGLAKDICEECLKLLREPEKSQATPAIKVMNSFLTTTPSIRIYTLSQVIPQLLKTFMDPDEISNRGSTLGHLATLALAARDEVAVDMSMPPVLQQHKDEMVGAFVSGLGASTSVVQALKGLDGLVTTKGLVTDEELGYVVHNINDILQGNNDEEATDAALDLLSTIATTTPKHVEQLTLPLLFGVLPDVAPSRDASIEREKCWLVLSHLTRLCVQPSLFEVLVIRLSAKLDLVISNINNTEDTEVGVAYIHAILHTLSQVLLKKVERQDPDVPKYVDRLLPHLFRHFISSAIDLGKLDDIRLVKVGAEIVTQVLQTVNAQKQSSFYESLFAAYLKSETSALVGGKTLEATSVFLPFASDSSSSQKAMVPLFAAALVPSFKEAKIPVDDLTTFLQDMVGWSIRSAEDEVQRMATWHIVSSVLNKHVDDLASFLSWSNNIFHPEWIANTAAPALSRQKAIATWSRITRGLLVRNHTSGISFSQNLFSLFNDEDSNVAWDAARAIGVIGGSDEVLTKRNNAVIRMLWAQKYCNTMLPRLMEGSLDFKAPRSQTAHLVALTSLIKSVPKSTYSDKMPSLLPLLIRGLDLPDADIRASIIDTLYASASSTGKDSKTPEHNAVAEHASTLAAAMLKNARVKETPSTRVRVAALRYLGLMPSVMRYDVLHPHRSVVLRELAGIVDDPKKVVRKEAVDARSSWFTAEG